jgi:putative membrane protein
MKVSKPAERDIKKYIAVFYMVGTAGMLLPFSFHVFRDLIPWVLILCFLILIWYHPDRTNRRSWLFFIIIFLIGLAVEMIGVQTGRIFGNYWYGASLGLKLFNTPLIIGLNWLFLIIVTGSAVAQLRMNGFFSVILGAVAMVVYDLVLEQVASPLDMWHWKENVIPFRNYLAWFILSLFFHAIIRLSGVRVFNPLALVLVICQFTYLLILSIALP